MKEGATESAHVTLRDALQRMGYANGFVSVDTYDWYINQLMNRRARDGKPVSAAVLERAYVRHLMACLQFSDRLARQAGVRDLPHVLLLHENDAAVFFLPALVRTLRKAGWQLIPIRQAYAHPSYRQWPTTPAPVDGSLPVQLLRAKQPQWRAERFAHPSESTAYWDRWFSRQR